MVITYIKKTGEIVAPVMTSPTALTLVEVIGKEKTEIFKDIYDVINIVDDRTLFDTIFNYKVENGNLVLKNPTIPVVMEVQHESENS